MPKYEVWYNEDPSTFPHTQNQWRVCQDIGATIYAMGSVEQYAPEAKGLGKGKANARKAAEAFARSKGATSPRITEIKDAFAKVEF